MPPPQPSRRVLVPSHVSLRVFDEETVLLNLDSGQYYGLDAAGTAFWQAMQEAGTIEGALVTLEEHLGVERGRLHTDLERFCQDLRSRGLIELVSG